MKLCKKCYENAVGPVKRNFVKKTGWGWCQICKYYKVLYKELNLRKC